MNAPNELTQDDDIADETEESKQDEIEDFYENEESMMNTKKNQDIDLDYSQTHLEDFLKSQTQSQLLKGSQVQTGQLLNSFITTYNKMTRGPTTLKHTTKVDVEQIEEENVSEHLSEEDEDFDDFGRSEDRLDLENVEVGSSPKKQAKPIISQEEAQKIIALSDKIEKKKAA